MNLPEEYLCNMQDLLKQDFQKYLDCFSVPACTGLRVNTSKISVEDFLKISPFHLEPVPWCAEGFYCKEEDKPSLHPYYHAGLYYLQEPSAMSPGSYLPIEPDDIVLDGCSAPGGKTTQLACRLTEGLLISNDISSSRQQATLKNIERHGLGNVYVTSTDISKFPNNTFDKILLDTPCSGEGMFRKDPSLVNSWIKRNHEYYRPIQKSLIDSAVPLLKDGGMLMYSTCTFNPHEDEEVIEYALSNYPELTLADMAMVVLTATLASIGTAGVSGAGMIMLAMVLTTIGIPVEGIAIIAGVDKIFDMGRTTLNITGDATCALWVSRLEAKKAAK